MQDLLMVRYLLMSLIICTMKKKLNILSFAFAALLSIFLIVSCDLNDNYSRDPMFFTALVTYEDSESGVRLQLDDSTSLVTSNLKPGLYDNKTVRALIQYYRENSSSAVKEENTITVVAVDTIRTKPASQDMGELNDSYYGTDKLEIIRDWVTIGEDGYLTLIVRTHRGCQSAVHSVYLVNKGEENGKYNFELRHDADGDVYGMETDGLISFNLNELAPEDRSPVTLHLTWEGFYETKSADFKLTFRKK